MKTEISRDSYQSEKRYSGVYQQQGRMLTDADWNELVEILKTRLNEALRDVVGSQLGSIGGTPRHRALRIVEDGSVKIQPGHVYINGMAATLPGDAPLEFDQQPDFPEPPTPTGDYQLYADVWERTVTQLMDERLRDKGLHGADTCSRKQMLAQIKWCPDTIDPEQTAGNPGKGDAGLTLTLLQKTTDPDSCDPCAAELDIETRVGNYLFRVEVHDVQGDADGPTEITLKWSSENGAEQFLALPLQDEMPAGFISDKWVYEFFDQTSERHLGVHLNSTAWQPARVELKEFSETSGAYAVPTIPGSSETQTFVRRWDGYCKLDLTNGLLMEGVDRGVDLDTGKTVDSLGYVSIGSTLEIVLNSLSLELELTGKSFVAGDYWLADVREAEHGDGSKLLDNKTPQGIEHYYLALGSVSGGVLQANTEIDRKYAFPPLTQMTRLFMAGGDGQEIVPGEPLPQPLRVGVANGEWPVVGATVRFEIEGGGGSLSVVNGGLTSADGIAECEWSPGAVIGASCRVKASLVDPDHPAEPSHDLAPPVYFYANLISADQVAYAPDCQPDTNEASVHHLLLGPDASRLGSDDYYTVKEVLDALLCELKADHVPYDDPACSGNTVKNLLAGLDINSDGHLTVKDVLDTLLCRLEAQHVPYNPADQGSRWDDINEGGDPPTTVQQAIDDLAENLESTDIRYEVPDCSMSTPPTVRSGLGMSPGDTVKVDEVLDKLLCEFNADDLPLDRSADLCTAIDADSSVKTVQDALNYLCDHMGGVSCAITVGKGGQFDTLDEAFEALKELKEICICLLPGEHRIEKVTDVGDKISIRIAGCGAQASRIFIINTLALQAIDIQLRDLSIIGGDKEGNATEAGSLLLAGIKSAHFIVENCVFDRVFSGDQARWLPLVSVEGSVKLDWHNNRMMATRLDGEVTDAVIPDKGALTGPALAAADKLEKLLASSPYADIRDYEEKVKDAAVALVGLSNQARNKFFNARSVDNINNLPVEVVSINRTNRILLARPGLPGLTLPDTDTSAVTGSGTMRMALAVSPRTEVEAFYNDIKIAEADISKVIDRLRALADLVTSFDYALALASNTVDGSIAQNEFLGNVALHFSSEDSVPLSWPTTLGHADLVKNKAQWAAKNLTPSWETVGQLSLQGNKVNAVHSMVTRETLKDIRSIVLGEAAAQVTLDAYESMSLSDNYFDEDQNSLISKFMTLNGNQFLYQEGKEITLAYTLGYRGIFLGNMSFGLSNDGGIVIEQMMHDFYESVNANFLRII